VLPSSGPVDGETEVIVGCCSTVKLILSTADPSHHHGYRAAGGIARDLTDYARAAHLVRCVRRAVEQNLNRLIGANREDQLVLHAESEAGSCADFLHADFLEPEALKAGAFERPETGA
jgi:hypothetical protein